ncbi:MAG: hypothetical protein QG608_469 [Actinomycetota bacterium]|nr:hypothetical protein [Actinomycetota bacterium]
MKPEDEAVSDPSPQPVPDPVTAVEWPGISVVMPVLNEERYLAQAVQRVLSQDYPGPIEVVMALGPSQDRTDEVAAQLVASDSRVRTVPNPSGRTPAALNAALAASRYPVVLRVDGHGMLCEGYARRAVELLRSTGAANVGGIMAAEGETTFECAVAAAMTSPLGVGAASFHTGGQAGPADTVYLGVFRRQWLTRLGGYDEAFVRAQDWQLNYRIRQAGGLIWFDPSLRVSYRPRPTFKALARQYRDYGRWRRVVLRVHPGSAGLRYFAPPAALLAVLVGTVLGIAGTPWANLWGFLLPGGYAVGVTVGALVIRRGLSWKATLALPWVLATMHGSWGLGFLTSPRSIVPHGRAGTVCSG